MTHLQNGYNNIDEARAILADIFYDYDLSMKEGRFERLAGELVKLTPIMGGWPKVTDADLRRCIAARGYTKKVSVAPGVGAYEDVIAMRDSAELIMAADAMDGKFVKRIYLYKSEAISINDQVKMQTATAYQKLKTGGYIDSHSVKVEHDTSVVAAANAVLSNLSSKTPQGKGKPGAWHNNKHLLVAVHLVRRALITRIDNKVSSKGDYLMFLWALIVAMLGDKAPAPADEAVSKRVNKRLECFAALKANVDDIHSTINMQACSWILGRVIEAHVIETIKSSEAYECKESSIKQNRSEDIDFFVRKSDAKDWWAVSLKTGRSFTVKGLAEHRKIGRKNAPELYMGVDISPDVIGVERDGRIHIKGKVKSLRASVIDRQIAGEHLTDEEREPSEFLLDDKFN